MKINLTVSNEHHIQLLSSIVDNMRDSAFNDVTLVCSDGRLRVNGLTLALLLPIPYRSLHLEEGAILLLPQYRVEEIWAMGVPENEEEVQEKKQEVWQYQNNVPLKEVEIETEPGAKELKPIPGIKFQDQTEQSLEHDESVYGMGNSSDEDGEKEEENEDRRSSMIYIPKEEHMPKEELAKVTARYMPGYKSSTWLVINEQFTFKRTQQEQARKNWTKTVSWTCSGRRNTGCMARALTHWIPREGASQPKPGSPVDLVLVWRNQLHTCNVNHGNYIFISDLKNKIKQRLLENPTLKYKTAFQESKAFLISRIPSKDLRKKLRKECKVEGYRSWFYAWKQRKGERQL